MSTNVNGNSIKGFIWEEFYEIETTDEESIYMTVRRVSEPLKMITLSVRIFLRSDVTLFEQSGITLDGFILENGKRFLRELFETKIEKGLAVEAAPAN